jgi:hypothetical protein
MASVSIGWDGDEGFDIHLLPGETSSSLLDLLVIKEDTTPPTFSFANTPPADIDAASFAFTPNFISAAVPPANGGVTVDTKTGKVTVAPAPTLRSFVLEATVRTKPPNAKTLGPIPIRVLVHTAILDIWLTPKTLTIRQGSDGLRLTVLARFDDQTIGDITRRPGITWKPDHGPIAVDASGALTASTNPATVPITATHAGHVATAEVKAKAPWSTPGQVKLLAGSAGVDKAATVPNVLFLSEGFTAAEETTFGSLVQKLVNRLQTTESLRPYDFAKKAVNYWMAFVPSRERGTSVLYDLRPVARATLFGAEIPAPVKPAPGTPFTLENLIYHVGLPTPADAAVAPGSARATWLLQYGVGVSLFCTDAVYAQWQALSDHRLANERDSAFGIRNGQRPTMHHAAVPREMGLHPLRATRNHLDSFLQKLKVGPATLGAIWVAQDPDPAHPIANPSGPGLPAGLKVGQDRRLVFMLCGGTRYGGSELDGLILSSLVSDVEVRLQAVAGTRQVNLVPFNLPSIPSLWLAANVAHETSHAFGLEDEYGEFPVPLRIPATQEASLKPAANAQPASELERSAVDLRLDPAKLGKIKWLWPRVEHAGVLDAQPAPNGAAFDVRMVHGQAAGFKHDDLVRLRRRPLLDHPQPSGRLNVDKVTGDVVTVVPLVPGSITAADWPAGSILIRPVRGAPTAADLNGPDLPLVAPIISGHLATSSIPLNQKPPPPAPACAVDTSPVQSALNLPAGLPVGRPKFKAQIVGLYDGGVRYHCGVFHPSGACVMRALLVPGGATTYLFCPVCRYFLVDRIDPTKHGVIDLDYRKRYPQP